jgi:hypothetical protein
MSAPRSCASCDEQGCAMNRRHGRDAAPGLPTTPDLRTAYVLDQAWPEYARFVAASRGPGDELLAPGLLGPRPARYAWPGPVRHAAVLETARRHLAMRRTAQAAGAVRQRTYLDHDRALGLALARAIDYRARHLVVALAWLPWLDEAGVLGGRSYDVLMSRYPLAEVHRLLDHAAAAVGPSATIADFRADAGLAAREAALLARARRIVTPHAGIAALFPEKALKLAWHRPTALARRPGSRVAFLGPTIMRQRPDLVRERARSLEEPLIVFGAMLEGPDFWDGVAIERRRPGPGWLDGIGAILHPAAMTAEPRPLLEALAAGVEIYANEGCGLDVADYRPFETFTAGTAEERRAAA